MEVLGSNTNKGKKKRKKQDQSNSELRDVAQQAKCKDPLDKRSRDGSERHRGSSQ